MQGYHRGAWLVGWCWLVLGIRSAFLNVCNIPQDTISSNPSPTVPDKLGGRRDRNGREAEKVEWMEPEKAVQRRVMTEVEEGNNESDKKCLLHTHPNQIHTNTHNVFVVKKNLPNNYKRHIMLILMLQ